MAGHVDQSTCVDGIDALGQRLQALRAKYGYSLREVERRSEGQIRSSHLSQIETGRVSSPSLSFLRELARVYHMSLADLILELDLADTPGQSDGHSPQQILALAHMSEMTEAQQDEAVQFMRWIFNRDEDKDDSASA
jgi:transcriptional regulator with XRE-family HTH domain